MRIVTTTLVVLSFMFQVHECACGLDCSSAALMNAGDQPSPVCQSCSCEPEPGHHEGACVCLECSEDDSAVVASTETAPGDSSVSERILPVLPAYRPAPSTKSHGLVTRPPGPPVYLSLEVLRT
jgi:hypothetical protein